MNDQKGLSLFQKLTYATGECGNSLLNISFVLWSMYFYAPTADDKSLVPLVPVALAGIAMSAGRVVDAITDPLVAYWSDRLDSRWGRRKPFVVIAAPLLFIVFVFLWMPPVAGESMINFVFLIIMASLFWSLYTVVRIPYVSLIPEIAVTSKERVNLSAWVAVMMIVGNGFGMMGSSMLVEKFSFRTMGLVCGLVCVLCWYLSISFIREKKYEMSDYRKFSILQAVATTFKNRPFLIFLYSFFSFQLGFNILTGGMPYIVTVILGKPKDAVGSIFIVCFASVLLFVPVVSWLSNRYGKKIILSISIFFIAIFLSLTYFLGKVDIPFSVMMQIYVIMALMGFPIAGFFILPNAITADIVDYDEKMTGLRREAIYYGVSGFAWKLAIALSAVIMGYLFKYYGYSSQNDLGVRLLGPVSALFIFVAFIVFQFYSLEDRPKALSEKQGGAP